MGPTQSSFIVDYFGQFLSFPSTSDGSHYCAGRESGPDCTITMVTPAIESLLSAQTVCIGVFNSSSITQVTSAVSVDHQTSPNLTKYLYFLELDNKSKIQMFNSDGKLFEVRCIDHT